MLQHLHAQIVDRDPLEFSIDHVEVPLSYLRRLDYCLNHVKEHLTDESSLVMILIMQNIHRNVIAGAESRHQRRLLSHTSAPTAQLNDESTAVEAEDSDDDSTDMDVEDTDDDSVEEEDADDDDSTNMDVEDTGDESTDMEEEDADDDESTDTEIEDADDDNDITGVDDWTPER